MDVREELAGLVRWIYGRGWSPGTGGNYSMKLADEPLRVLITPSGIDKGSTRAADLIEVDEEGRKAAGNGAPSAETLIHVAIFQETSAQAALHTHSVWNTLLSLRQGPLVLEGYELLKGLRGISTHDCAVEVPILENSQDMADFSGKVRALLRQETGIYGFLMRGHGLYTWGESLFEAKRHLEVLEFLFEVEGLKTSRRSAGSRY